MNNQRLTSAARSQSRRTTDFQSVAMIDGLEVRRTSGPPRKKQSGRPWPAAPDVRPPWDDRWCEGEREGDKRVYRPRRKRGFEKSRRLRGFCRFGRIYQANLI